MLQSIEQQREQFRGQVIEAPEKFRILHIGRFTNGETDVVACLYRALVNLGHQVFHLDTELHNDIIENPYKKLGGFGPIFVKLDAIQSIINELEPHCIILNAGGLCFSEVDAARLKKAGIIVIGVTLSDPDVLPSVAEYANRFDYHTTNAEAAVRMYEKRGLKNTLYMPFAIDRSFILQDVPHDENLEADVICIGHATARQDRNAVMKTLAEFLDVKVYGRGWEFEDAEVVEGLSLLQASRAGKVHVNFPGTRAGYTNIKCGVFETIGSGRVLCTGEFDEMRNFFQYGEEIIAYNTPTELVENVKHLLADENRYENMRRKAFRRLLDEHLYEHRWLEIFSKIKHDLASQNPIVGKDCAARFKSRLKGSSDYVQRVIISGFYGARNIGDELILSSFRQAFRRNGKNLQAIVACEHPRNVERDHGVIAFRRSTFSLAEAAVKSSSAVVVGGGGLWHDYTFDRAGGLAGLFQQPKISVTGMSAIPLLANILRKPVHGFGLGVGPLHDADCKAFVRYAGSLMDSIVVRDVGSKDLLNQIDGWNVDVSVEPDAVYSYELPEVFSEPKLPDFINGQRYIVVNLRPWSQKALDLVELASEVGSFCLESDVAIVCVPMQPGSQLDEKVLREFVEYLPKDVMTTVKSLNDTDNREVLDLLNGSSAVLAMRLHMSLLAHRMGRPAVGLAYDPKVFAHFSELGREKYVFSVDSPAAEIAEQLRKAVVENSIDTAAASTIKMLEGKARNAMEELTSRIVSAQTQYNPLGLGSLVAGRHLRVVGSNEGSQPSSMKRGQAGNSFGLGSATVMSGSEKKKKRAVPMWFEISREQAMVKLRESAPRKGDYVALNVLYDVRTAKPHVLVMDVHSPYQSEHVGRLEWLIEVDGSVMFREDVASEGGRRKIEIPVEPRATQVSVEVRVRAMKNCEDWGWGGASRIYISNMHRRAYRRDESLDVVVITDKEEKSF